MENPNSKPTPFSHLGTHKNESSSELAPIAEIPAPNTANTETNDFQHDISSANRKSILRPALDGAEPKQPDHDIGQGIAGQRSISRTNTGESKSRATRLNHPSPLSRTTSSESSFVPTNPRRNSTIQTNASSSFEETAFWDRKAILSLDGGGIRGYSALLIIRALMKAIGDLEKNYVAKSAISDGPAQSSYHPLSPGVSATTDAASIEEQLEKTKPDTDTSPWLPCHYFDYMAGTSTGGLISIMIGRLRMNIDDCIRDYEKLGGKVFGRSRWFSIRFTPLFWIRDKYNHKILRDVVKEVVRARVPKVAEFPGGRNFAFDENRCRVVVIAYQETHTGGVGKPYLFRTYKNLHISKDPKQRVLDRNPALAHDIPIWQVARATSAAPTYFKPAKIDNLEYLDGGFGSTNNPSVEIYDEVCNMNNEAKDAANVVVSIGTGKNNKISRWNSGKAWMPGSRFINYMNFAKKWASESETKHNDMLKLQRKFQFKYYRLNVDTGLDEMKLDEWRARGDIRTGAGKCIGRLRAWMHKSQDSTAADNHQNEKHSKINDSGDSTDSFSTAEPIDLPIPKWLQPRNKTLETITEHTNTYLEQEEVKKWIMECAQLLVEGRRQRARIDPQRWEKACFGAWYQCRIHECPRGEKEYEELKGMRQHLLDKHRDQFRPHGVIDNAALEAALNECKIIVH